MKMQPTRPRRVFFSFRVYKGGIGTTVSCSYAHTQGLYADAMDLSNADAVIELSPILQMEHLQTNMTSEGCLPR